MSVERTYHCDAPTQNPDVPGYEDGKPCGGHVRTMTPPPYLPMGFLRVEQGSAGVLHTLHFCGWDCLLRYAATIEPPEFIPA